MVFYINFFLVEKYVILLEHLNYVAKRAYNRPYPSHTSFVQRVNKILNVRVQNTSISIVKENVKK